MSGAFDAIRDGTGTREWAEFSENIQKGCPCGCLYCYAASNAVRFRQRERGDWVREELTKKAGMTSYPKRDGIVMFPTAHDITPHNIDASSRVLRLMLEAGNEVLIVSKPRFECIARLCRDLEAYKRSILFRFTIGTLDEAVAAHWEPGAPTPHERIESLALAYTAGYRTSISAEPLLGGVDTARALLAAVRPLVTDTVWIGKMNKISTRVDLSVPANAEHARVIELAQTDAEILRLYHALDGDPLVRWKDSVKEVVARRAAAREAV